MVQKYGQELKPSGELIISPSSEETSNKGALSQLTEDSDWSSQVLQGRCIQYSYDINNRFDIVQINETVMKKTKHFLCNFVQNKVTILMHVD